MAYVPQSGGGKAPGFDTGDGYILSKPYELVGSPTMAMIDQLNEMLDYLYRAVNRVIAQVATNTADISLLQSQVATLQALIIVIQGQIASLGTRVTTLEAAGSGGSEIQVLDAVWGISEIYTMFSVPLILVPAPLAGKMIDVISLSMAVTCPNAFTAGGGGTWNLFTNTQITWASVTNDLNNARNKMFEPTIAKAISLTSANVTAVNGCAVTLKQTTADWTSGGLGASLATSIAYRVVTCPS